MEGEIVDTIQIMYNTRYGGFGFSEMAEKLYCKAKGMEWTGKKIWNIERTDPDMIRIVKDLGGQANTPFSDVSIKTIKRKYEKHYYIAEYDGLESVHIDYKQYRLDQLLEVLNTEGLAAEDMLRMIREILARRDETDDSDSDSESSSDDICRDESVAASRCECPAALSMRSVVAAGSRGIGKDETVFEMD